jgi:SAM-dependent methyltransferase
VEETAGPGGRLLEVGVGTGRIALPCPCTAVVGVDLSLPMLARCRAKAAAAGLAPPPVVRADATRLPLGDACVDAVLEVHVLHLVPAWELALAEARRVLVAGGLLLHGGGGRHQRGSGSPHDQVIGRFEELVGAAGRPRLVGASHEQVLERLEAMAPGSRSWSRSSGRSRRPTPRRWTPPVRPATASPSPRPGPDPAGREVSRRRGRGKGWGP